MSLIEWNNDISVGIDSIDEQHKELVNLINLLHEAMNAGKAKNVLEDIFNKLVDYTIEHFRYEEGLLDKHGYPDTASHKQKHEELRKQVLELKDRFKDGDFMMGVETNVFLRDWLVNHIMHNDKKYSEFLTGVGVT